MAEKDKQKLGSAKQKVEFWKQRFVEWNGRKFGPSGLYIQCTYAKYGQKTKQEVISAKQEVELYLRNGALKIDMDENLDPLGHLMSIQTPNMAGKAKQVERNWQKFGPSLAI